MYASVNFNRNLAVVTGMHMLILCLMAVLPAIFGNRTHRIVNPIPIELVMSSPRRGNGIPAAPRAPQARPQPAQEPRHSPPQEARMPPPPPKPEKIVPVTVASVPDKPKQADKPVKTTVKTDKITKTAKNPAIVIGGRSKPSKQTAAVHAPPPPRVSENEIRNLFQNAIQDVGGRDTAQPAASGGGSWNLADAAGIEDTGGSDDPDAVYWNIIYQTFYSAWSQPSYDDARDAKTVVTITLDAYGRIASRELTRSSGRQVMDASVMQAVASVRSIPGLPRDFTLKHPEITMEFKLEPR